MTASSAALFITGKRAGQREHDGIRQRVGLVTIARGDPREDLGGRLDLHVDLETDDSFVGHLMRFRSWPQRTQSSDTEVTEPNAEDRVWSG